MFGLICAAFFFVAASAVAFDAHGRAAETLSLDGVRATGEFDAWGNPTRLAATSATGELISEQTFDRTGTGRVRAAVLRKNSCSSIFRKSARCSGIRDECASRRSRC